MNEYNFPREYNINDYVEFNSIFDSYDPNDGWELLYKLVDNVNSYDVNTVQNLTEKSFDVVITTAESNAWLAGTYQLYAILSRTVPSAQRVTMKLYTVEIMPDVTTDLLTGPVKSHAQTTLEAIEAVIENRATVDQEEYSIGNRMLKRMNIKDLLYFRDIYRQEVEIEEATSNNEKINTVSGVFGRIF